MGFVYGTIPRKPAESLKQNVLSNLAKLGLCFCLLDIVSSGFCYRNSPCSLLQCPPSGPAGLWEHWPQSGCIPVFSRSMRRHAQKNKTQFRITIHESELPVLRLLHLHKYKSKTFVERTRTRPVSTVATSLTGHVPLGTIACNHVTVPLGFNPARFPMQHIGSRQGLHAGSADTSPRRPFRRYVHPARVRVLVTGQHRKGVRTALPETVVYSSSLMQTAPRTKGRLRPARQSTRHRL